MYITIRKIESRGAFAVGQRKSNLVLCDNLEVRSGVGGGREVQEGGDIYGLMADSCWCMAETNTIL